MSSLVLLEKEQVISNATMLRHFRILAFHFEIILTTERLLLNPQNTFGKRLVRPEEYSLNDLKEISYSHIQRILTLTFEKGTVQLSGEHCRILENNLRLHQGCFFFHHATCSSSG